MTTEAYLARNIAALAGLKELKAKGPALNTGICSNAHHYASLAGHLVSPNAMIKVVIDWAKDWEWYSGSSHYPVPDPETLGRPEISREEVSDRAAGIYADRCYENARWEGEYGDLRRELLDFLIEVIEDFVETNK